MRNLLQRIIVEERRAAGDSARGGRAALRICEKLRAPMVTFAGVAGFRSLLSRALKLARAGTPLLGELEIKPDGTIHLSAELEASLDTEDGAAAAADLAGQLLALLVVLIGDKLTERIIYDVWPTAAPKGSKSS